jgi:hypothetical protein
MIASFTTLGEPSIIEVSKRQSAAFIMMGIEVGG